MTTESLDFISQKGKIEESSGRRRFRADMEAKIKDYEKKMLSFGRCPYSLPMNFLWEDKTLIAVYDFTGFLQMKEYLKRKMICGNYERGDQKLIEDLLQTLSGILECIRGMENYLIFPDRITIHPDTVFINLSTGRAALAFYPNVNPEQTLQSRITGLIHELRGAFHSDETDPYLKKIEDFIFMNNPGLDGMISFLGTMQREAGYIYWNSKNFRKVEEQDAPLQHDKIMKRGNRFDFRIKIAVIQIILSALLLAVFLSGKLEMMNFAGLAIIVAAVDLLILRKQQAI